jgi:hypothetical protein
MRKKTHEVSLAEAFAAFAARFPVAKGSLTATHSPCTRKGCRLCAEGRGHPKLIFTFRENGKLRGLYVRPQHEARLRRAIENGRELERLLVESGRDMVLGMRSVDDAK